MKNAIRSSIVRQSRNSGVIEDDSVLKRTLYTKN